MHHTFFYIFCSEDLQLLQQPIDAWQFLQHLLYQSTAVKKANAPGLTRTYYYTNILHLCRSYPCPGCVASGVDRYDCYFKFFPAILNSSLFCANFGSTWCSFRSLRKLSMHLGLGLIGSILSTFIVDISLRYIILIFSHHMGIPYNAALCDIMIGLTIIQVVVRPNLLFTHSYTSSMLILSCCRHLYLTSSGCFCC